MDPWRLITTWGAAPGFNMGLDQALLEARDAVPTLRFYTWSPDTLSIGYFQRLSDVPGAGSAGAVVRRITGGGAIHHVNELTFSIAVSARHELYAGPIAESYVRVHNAIAAALAEYGIEASLRGDARLSSDREGTGMCFHRSTEQDLVWNGAKGAGSAQRRRRGRVLHHGSIKLGTSPLEGPIATVDGGLTAQELAPTLQAMFEIHLGLRLEAGVPDAEERAAARHMGARYLSPEFLHRR